MNNKELYDNNVIYHYYCSLCVCSFFDSREKGVLCPVCKSDDHLSVIDKIN